MSNELLKMKRNAVMLGLCGKYKSMWDNAESKKALMDIALDANGVEFICEAHADGWGLSTEFLLREFGDYVNGYISKIHGYTSAMYVGLNRHELAPNDWKGLMSTSTLLTFIDCDISLNLPRYAVGKIYVCGNSDIHVRCDGRYDVYLYGENNRITSTGNGTVTLHKVEKGTWAGRQQG